MTSSPTRSEGAPPVSPARAALRRWLSPPPIEDEDLRRTASSLYPILVSLVAVCVVAAGMLAAIGNWDSAAGGLGGAALGSLEIALIRRGRVEAATNALLLTMPVMTAYLAWVGNGLLDVAILLYPVLILLASLLVSIRRLLLVTGLALLSLGAVVAGHLTGRLDSHGIERSALALDGLFAAIFLGLAAMIGYLLARSVRQSLARARTSEARYRALVDSVPVGIYTSRPDGRVLYANDRYAEILELSGPQEALARNAVTLYKDPGDRTRFLQHLERDGRVEDFECMAVTGKGNERSVVLSAYRDGATISGLLTDVTERRRAERERLALEAQLRQSQKMEAIGTLAGGIAHDFNNILAIIMGAAEAVRHELPPGSEPARDVAEIVAASERARHLVARIMAFSRRADTHPVPCEVEPVVREALRFLRAAVPVTIEFRDRLEASGAVVIDPTQLHQVVMNLVTNAFHAMEVQGGILEVALARVRLDGSEAQALALEPGDYVRLTVSDTGTGIPRELLGRIFEPYFTTKEAGRGTGLGLSVVHGIVTAAGGQVRVYSDPGLGTTFHVFLPGSGAAASLQAPSEAAPPTGTERVLVVDDEAMVVAMLEKNLEALGYRVVVAASPEAALQALRADPQGFDLVITDLTMPGMDGVGVAREVLAARPGLPVLVCTGFSEQLTAERVRALGVCEVLLKPVPRARLARAVRRALDGAGPADGEAAGVRPA
jgi:two-component system, cell cycle sensor histidine kinase and response regulator CckA